MLAVTNIGRVDDGLAALGEQVRDLSVIGPVLQGAPIPIVAATGFRGGLDLHVFAPAGIGQQQLDAFATALSAELDRVSEG